MSTTQKKLFWDETKTDKVAWLKFYPEAIDVAISIETASSLDENGVAFEAMSPAAFLLFFGAPPQPRMPMGPAVGAGAALANHNKLDKLTTNQENGKAEFRNIILEAVPKRLLIPMQDANRSLRLRTTSYICTTLNQELGTLDKEDLDFLMGELSKSFLPGTPVSTFLANWVATLGDLERAGQILPQTMATDILQKCFGPEFSPCWVLFVQNQPLVANRTVARLSAAINLFAKDSLPLLASHSAIGISEVINQKEQINKMQARIDLLEHQALAVNSDDSRKRGQAFGVDRAVKKQPRTALSARPFCWSHGPRGHLGCDCTSPLIGHDKDATWKQQKGSKWKDIFVRKGWATA
jgi:hypothetical protein